MGKFLHGQRLRWKKLRARARGPFTPYSLYPKNEWMAGINRHEEYLRLNPPAVYPPVPQLTDDELMSMLE